MSHMVALIVDVQPMSSVDFNDKAIQVIALDVASGDDLWSFAHDFNDRIEQRLIELKGDRDVVADHSLESRRKELDQLLPRGFRKDESEVAPLAVLQRAHRRGGVARLTRRASTISSGTC